MKNEILPRVLSRDKKQQGYRIRKELVEFMENFVEDEKKHGNIISQNDVIEFLIDEFRRKNVHR